MPHLIAEIFKKLFELQPETFFNTDLGSRIKLSKLGEESVLRRAVPINDTYFIEVSYLTKDFFDRIKHALSIFEFENMKFLYVKRLEYQYNGKIDASLK